MKNQPTATNETRISEPAYVTSTNMSLSRNKNHDREILCLTGDDMFVKTLNTIYDPKFSQINYSVIDDEFNINFFVSDNADITELTNRIENSIFLHNRTNPSTINYEIKNRNIIFTGDVDVIFKTLKEDLVITEELYLHLQEDKELNAYITREKLEIKKSALDNQPAQDTNTISSQMPFFKSTRSTSPSQQSTTTSSAASSANSSISTSEIEEIQQLQERVLRLSDEGKKLFLENITKTLNKDDGSKIKPISVK